MTRFFRPALLGLLLTAQAVAQGEPIYRYVDEDGVVHYTDKPPSQNAQPADLPPLRTYTPAELEAVERQLDENDGSNSSEKVEKYRELRIVTPSPEETIRGAERIVPVAVTSDPSLVAGHRVQFFLDGEAQAPPALSTSTVFSGVERGTHTVSAAIVDEQGKALIRAQPVQVFVKPPIAR